MRIEGHTGLVVFQASSSGANKEAFVERGRCKDEEYNVILLEPLLAALTIFL